MTTVAKVQAALRAESTKIDRAHRGVHVFDPIQPSGLIGCNWTSNFRCIGSSVPLDDMRAALERVQARYPVVEFK
jgi:hypothetical protein